MSLFLAGAAVRVLQPPGEDSAGSVGEVGEEMRGVLGAREQKLEIGIHGTLDGELGAPGTKALTVGWLIKGGEGSVALSGTP